MVTSMRGNTIRALRKSIICPNKWAFPSLSGIYVKPVCSFRLLVIICTAEVMLYFKRQTEQSFKKDQEIITCPMYVPCTCTKTVACTRHGAGQFSCGDSFWCMWPVTHALITRLSSGAFSVDSFSCSKSQGQWAVHRCWWAAVNPVDVRRHSTRYCPATAV